MTPIIVPKRFTEEQCKNIISLHSEGWTETIGQIKDGIVEPSTRQNTTYVPPTINHVPNELINEIFRVISFVNDKFFNFDLAEGVEDPRFFPMELTLLRYDLGDHYETHIDIGPSAPNRKLSFTLMLNDSFDGGEVRFVGQEKKTENNLGIGDMIIFPSFLAHKIKPITSGIRWSLVGWALGNIHFK